VSRSSLDVDNDRDDATDDGVRFKRNFTGSSKKNLVNCCFSKIYTLVATRRLMKSNNNNINNNVTEEQAGRKDLMVSFLDCSVINNNQQRMARHKMYSWTSL
jgi:hypothetical protein